MPQDLWDAVQARLAGNGPGAIAKVRARHPSLLLGLIVDGHGRRMSSSHANRGSKSYRYYVTHTDAGIDSARPLGAFPRTISSASSSSACAASSTTVRR